MLRLVGLGEYETMQDVLTLLAAMGGAYEFTRLASANLREKDDSLNQAFGGFVAGSIIGLRCGFTEESNQSEVSMLIAPSDGSIPAVIGFGTLSAVVLGAYDFTGGSLSGPGKSPEQDDFERKQELRKNRRRPIEQTISELGEGRGIYGPGYDERRRERIKERYGIEVPAKA